MFTRSFNVYVSARNTVNANLQRVSKVAMKSRFAFLYLHLRLRMRQNKSTQKTALTVKNAYFFFNEKV